MLHLAENNNNNAARSSPHTNIHAHSRPGVADCEAGNKYRSITNTFLYLSVALFI